MPEVWCRKLEIKIFTSLQLLVMGIWVVAFSQRQSGYLLIRMIPIKMLIVFLSLLYGKMQTHNVEVPHGYFSTNIWFFLLRNFTTNYKSLDHQCLTLSAV